ncbi:OmpW family outer membrane protein [Candidatus Electrothrix sp.]|uniref:OmpW family outer membrane protein n=1 Tax=Candidatus Electrothrix sp. TaxID=2170559 RepID=UPI004057A2DA
MNKIIATGAALLVAGTTQLAHADNHKVRQEKGQHTASRDWAISGYIGMVDFDGEEKPDPFRPGVTHEMESETAVNFGIILSKYYNDFSFNLGIEYIQEVEITDEEDHVLAEHSHIPISLGVNYYFDTSIVDPYIGAGIGYSFNDSTVSEFISNQGMSAEHDHSMFYYLTAGVEYPVNDCYALFLAGRYTMGDADMTGNAMHPVHGQVQIEDEGSLDRYEVNVGVKYFF